MCSISHLVYGLLLVSLCLRFMNYCLVVGKLNDLEYTSPCVFVLLAYRFPYSYHRNYLCLMVIRVFQLINFAITVLQINYLHLYDGIIRDPPGRRWSLLQVGLG